MFNIKYSLWTMKAPLTKLWMYAIIYPFFLDKNL